MKEVELPDFSKHKKFEVSTQFRLGLVSGILIGALLMLALINTLVLFMPFNVLLKLLSMIIA